MNRFNCRRYLVTTTMTSMKKSLSSLISMIWRRMRNIGMRTNHIRVGTLIFRRDIGRSQNLYRNSFLSELVWANVKVNIEFFCGKSVAE